MRGMNISMLAVEINRARGPACSAVADEETRLVCIDAHVRKGRKGKGGGGGDIIKNQEVCGRRGYCIC